MMITAWQAAYLAISAMMLIFAIAIPPLILKDKDQFTFNRQRKR